MSRIVWKLLALAMVASLILACAPAAPTPVPTKLPAPAVPVAAPTTVPKVAPAVTTAPVATPRPVAPTATPAPKIKRGGTLVVAEMMETQSWDPALPANPNVQAESVALEAFLRWTLVDEKTGRHEPRPWLVESWQLIDPKTITLKLRHGVKFHDGSDWNADVAKWHLDRLLTHPKSAAKGFLAALDSVVIVDPYTVRLNLKFPSAIIFVNLTGTAGGTGSSGTMVISKVAFQKLGEEAMNNHAVGTGPFIMEDWRRDDRTLYKKWDQYWKQGMDGKPLPYLDRVEVRILRDQAVGLIELKTGTTQVVRQIPSRDIAGVKSNPDLGIIMMPWASRRMAAGFYPKKSPFGTNLKLRQASQYTINRDAMASTLGPDVLPAYYGLWVPSFPGWDERILKYEFNVDKAKQLMKEAGFADGVDVELKYQWQALGRIPEILQSMWGKVGIRTVLAPLDNTTFTDIAKKGDIEAILNAPLGSPDPDNFSRCFTCDGSANWWSYCNQALDKCMAEGREAYDLAQRHEIYKRCQTMLQEDSLTYGLVMVPVNVAYRKEVKNITVYQHLTDLREVWLDK